jgi:7-cyano-7-deazaguanine synthase in queuosine biosynthesis
MYATSILQAGEGSPANTKRINIETHRTNNGIAVQNSPARNVYFIVLIAALAAAAGVTLLILLLRRRRERR